MSSKKSANKTARASERKRLFNRSVKSRVKKRITVAEAKIAVGDSSAREESEKAVSIVDRAGSKGIFHRNKIARIKSRMVKKVNALEASGVEGA